MSFALSDLGDSEGAIRSARLAVRSAPDQVARSERRLDLAAVLISAGYTGTAVVELVPLISSRDPVVTEEAQLLLAVAHIHQAQWEQARRALAAHLDVSPGGGRALEARRASRVDSLLRVAAGRRPRSERLAVALSTIVPGLGQLYAGHPLEALHAAALSAASGYWTYYVAVEGTLLESALGPLPWFIRYYTGNRYWAWMRTEERNQTRSRETADRALSIIRGD
jgi:hypothetical protein